MSPDEKREERLIASGAPLFKVWSPDHTGGESEAEDVRELDAESAAQAWAEEYDLNASNYPIASAAGPSLVHVRDAAGALTVWKVTGEFSPSYYVEPAS